MNQPVHLLMPTFNVAPYINLSLTSILKQTYKNIETLIIDDASTDFTRNNIQEVIGNNNTFHLFLETENKGIAYRRNQLVSLSREIDSNSYFFWLDGDDTISDENFVTNLMQQMVKTNADICLYNFSILYEQKVDELKRNSEALVQDQFHSEQILSNIINNTSQIVTIDSYPEVATFTSLGWTKAYAPSIKDKWPQSNTKYLYEDFVYMAALYQADRITALPPWYKPIKYLRRKDSLTGQRKPCHFYNDVINQLLVFRENIKGTTTEKQEAANAFIKIKIDQYESMLSSLIKAKALGFSEDDLLRYREASNVFNID